jgi:ketosteroid isomerase-like protein
VAARGARAAGWPRATHLPKEVTGKYLVMWEKIGNDWKLAADIWNDGK